MCHCPQPLAATINPYEEHCVSRTTVQRGVVLTPERPLTVTRAPLPAQDSHPYSSALSFVLSTVQAEVPGRPATKGSGWATVIGTVGWSPCWCSPHMAAAPDCGVEGSVTPSGSECGCLPVESRIVRPSSPGSKQKAPVLPYRRDALTWAPSPGWKKVDTP